MGHYISFHSDFCQNMTIYKVILTSTSSYCRMAVPIVILNSFLEMIKTTSSKVKIL